MSILPAAAAALVVVIYRHDTHHPIWICTSCSCTSSSTAAASTIPVCCCCCATTLCPKWVDQDSAAQMCFPTLPNNYWIDALGTSLHTVSLLFVVVHLVVHLNRKYFSMLTCASPHSQKLTLQPDQLHRLFGGMRRTSHRCALVSSLAVDLYRNPA